MVGTSVSSKPVSNSVVSSKPVSKHLSTVCASKACLKRAFAGNYTDITPSDTRLEWP